MRLRSLHLQNFRACKDVKVSFQPYTCLVGPNGAGKSTILQALNLLFRNTGGSINPLVLSVEDAFDRRIDQPVVITAEFSDLSTAAKMALAPFLNGDILRVRARADFDKQAGQGPVKQFAFTRRFPGFAKFRTADAAGENVATLKTIYDELHEQYVELPKVSAKKDMVPALTAYEQKHLDLCKEEDTEIALYGTRGSNLLEPFIQWVYVPAVKDATTEQGEGRNSALGELLQRVVNAKAGFDSPLQELRSETSTKYKAIVDKQQTNLGGLSTSLSERLRDFTHSGVSVELQWQSQSGSVSIEPPAARAKVGDAGMVFEVALSGHGLQRAFILAVLHELASHQPSERNLLLGFEEPEIYQHPPQARHLAHVLESLGQQGSQVIATTHSPYFVSGEGVEAIRLFRKHKTPAESCVSATTFSAISDRLSKALNEKPAQPTAIMAAVQQILQPEQNEMFFCACPVFVEGLEDVAFIATWLELLGLTKEFRRLGCHFVPADGKSKMSRPLAIATLLGLAPYVVFDADTDVKNKESNKRDNACILNLCGSNADPTSPTIVREQNLTMWPTRIFDVVVQDIGVAAYETAEGSVKKASRLDHGVQRKNGVLIAGTLERLHKQGVAIPSLDKLCKDVIGHAVQASK